MPEGEGDIRIRPGLAIPAAEVLELASRASGPGGQHVNKSATRVTLRWSPRESAVLTEPQRKRLMVALRSRLTREGELVVHADRERSRRRNREAARERIAELVRGGLEVPRHRRKTAPSRASKARRQETKRQRGELKRRRRPLRSGDEG
jgi:ribosome-associated protein